MTRADVVASARKFLRTPYRHQGRLPFVGLDCVGLLIAVGKDLGFVDPEWEAPANYGDITDGTELDAMLAKWLDEVPIDELQDGDITVMLMGDAPQHTAILSEGAKAMIHASRASGMVVEHGMRGMWPSRIVKAFRVRGLE